MGIYEIGQVGIRIIVTGQRVQLQQRQKRVAVLRRVCRVLKPKRR
jgi:hypothetical protein